MGDLFPVTDGRGVARGLGRDLAERHGRPLVITQPEPWASLEPDLGTQPAAVVLVEGLERAYLEDLVADLPEGPVLGIGGGTAMGRRRGL
jgi:hypothetical protein